MANKALRIHLVDPAGEWRKKLAGFFSDLNIDLELTESSTTVDITIDFPSESEICDSKILHADGKIPCSLAFEISEKIGISRKDFGKLMNLLGIRISACQLGCFK